MVNHNTMTHLYKKKYDIIVVGAGHAGCEAALAAARMGCNVVIFTIDLEKVASMPCSPSIGGMAKGQIVKEIDSLGGEMAKITDLSAIQYKTLNTSKGRAVHSSRTQNDKTKYHIEMKKVLESHERIDLKQCLVEKLIIEDNRVIGIEDQTGYGYLADAVILSTGTFLSGLVHIGFKAIPAGRAWEYASYGLADQLKLLGLPLGRFKTGTPPRLKKSTIDFSKFQEQPPDSEFKPFSMFSSTITLPQVPCYMGRTSPRTKEIIQHNLGRSALHGGRIKGRAARYCPSLEDKIVRFSERESHHVILEPEGLDTQEIYASGLGNSLPMDIQIELVRSVEGLEHAEIMRPAYAIEYDYIDPKQLYATLETKQIKGLFFAGQINGTSGYEEAAGQGLWAGINAACLIQKRPAFILDRSEAYIAVMIDDLVTRGTQEPYRMFTSRAEYRLMLREDNADLRLMEKGHELGLISRDTYLDMLERKKNIADEIQRIKKAIIHPVTEVNDYLDSVQTPPIKQAMHLDQLLKRSQLSYDFVSKFAPPEKPIHDKIAIQAEIEIKYEGYIKRQLKDIEKFKSLELIKVPIDFDYSLVHGLSNELKEKLSRIQPASLGQASRVEGMTPAALTAIMIVLKVNEKKRQSI